MNCMNCVCTSCGCAGVCAHVSVCATHVWVLRLCLCVYMCEWARVHACARVCVCVEAVCTCVGLCPQGDGCVSLCTCGCGVCAHLHVCVQTACMGVSVGRMNLAKKQGHFLL